MKIQFWTIGKNHDASVETGINDFTKRITNYYPAAWKIIPPIKNSATLQIDELKKKEADIVLKNLTEHDYLILLDEKGKSLTSIQLSNFLQQRGNESAKQLVFLIGGAFGVDASILQRANFSWSLSALTFPHQIVRLILAEQVYRACSIMRNEKYHHA